MADQQRIPQLTGADELRASDRDREQVAQLLEEHYAAGRLTFDEVQQRIDSAYSSRTYGDLRALLRDLPATRPNQAPHKPAAITFDAPLFVRVRVSNLSPTARKLLARYVAITALLIVIWAATGASFFWPIWPMIGMGVCFLRVANGHGSCAMRHEHSRAERS